MSVKRSIDRTVPLIRAMNSSICDLVNVRGFNCDNIAVLAVRSFSARSMASAASCSDFAARSNVAESIDSFSSRKSVSTRPDSAPTTSSLKTPAITRNPPKSANTSVVARMYLKVAVGRNLATKGMYSISNPPTTIEVQNRSHLESRSDQSSNAFRIAASGISRRKSRSLVSLRLRYGLRSGLYFRGSYGFVDFLSEDPSLTRLRPGEFGLFRRGDSTFLALTNESSRILGTATGARMTSLEMLELWFWGRMVHLS